MHFFLAAALANLGKLEEAQVATQDALSLIPRSRFSVFVSVALRVTIQSS
jgi:hypothetical protein